MFYSTLLELRQSFHRGERLGLSGLTSALSILRAANAKRCFGPPSVETKDRASNFGVLYLTTKLSVVGVS